MNQETAVEKVFIEMTDRNLCAPIIEHEIKFYLRLMFAVGFEAKPKERNKKKRIVYQYNKAGEFIEAHPSLTEAAESVGLKVNSICEATSGRRPSAGGYYWRHKS